MGEIRIIGGQWKRSKLPVVDLPGLRPTADRIRETLFNWLGQTLTGWRVLDAFAGSGALGFEAASRGAEAVVMLEREAVLVDGLRASQKRLQATAIVIHRANALNWMTACAARFDLILLDPPFADNLFDRALAAAVPLLAEGGLIYVESPHDVAPPPGFTAWRQGRAGAVHYQLLRREDNPTP
ncbi:MULTISPECIES: 16S rRNA (guanine(966)-N(2))-methyltransferase RsmD [unclassified Roseateles]|uniref:16S rRNA (guanine(966)-N(2))-methyltransferase RsmD n=1 Tax=unclassified Roseateles TaxID=2626991 RepID=UPI0007022831|nr:MULTISPECIES: 16S rRNA (guanine(966)-N(2))-methyltransferase RsmD [unclassified Roseateles]KQW42895.1 16S rRNA (guanine(966)-N(2))-methyltransferase RsmD [Pelomonas sp. Root405]KRA69573.1 16S rRNA (guanine(966)-N(2))-methyltransferase RsmD [Pelomonas sp. Root662]